MVVVYLLIKLRKIENLCGYSNPGIFNSWWELTILKTNFIYCFVQILRFWLVTSAYVPPEADLTGAFKFEIRLCTIFYLGI